MQDSQLSKSAERSRQSQSRPRAGLPEPPAGLNSPLTPSTSGLQAKYQIRAKKGFLTAKNTTSGLVLLVYSKEFQLGVLLHLSPSVAPANPEVDDQNRIFAKSAITMILSEFEALGVAKQSLLTYVIGGSATDHQPAVSKVTVQRTLWNHGLSLTACDLGGRQRRSIWMDMESGRMIVRSEPLPKEDLALGAPLPAAC